MGKGAPFLFGKLEKVEGGVVRSLFLKAVSAWDPFIIVEDSSGPKWWRAKVRRKICPSGSQ